MTDHVDPFSSLRGVAAFRRGNPFEMVQERLRKPHWEMAENVLYKARAVLASDPAKAEAYVDTALRLPFDEDEQEAPAALQAHLMLYSLVTDMAEASGEGDSAWLDAAIEAMDASGPAGQAEMRVVLIIIENDFQLPERELRTLRRAVAHVEPALTLHDEGFPNDLLKERIMAVLALCERYEDAFDAYYE